MGARPPFKKKELPIRPPFKKKEPSTIMKMRPPKEVGPSTIMKMRPPKEVGPSTIMKMRPPIAERRKGKPVPPLPPKPINWTPLLPKPIKPAPGRSPKLKWNIKKR